MGNQMNIVFLENVKDLAKVQMEFLWKTLWDMKNGSAKEKALTSNMSISELDLDKETFTVQMGSDLLLKFSNKILVVDLISPTQIDSNAKNMVQNFCTENRSCPILFVIDLCLDSSDNEPEVGRLVGMEIKNQKIPCHEVLYTTGNINYCDSLYDCEDLWSVYRPTKDERMNERYIAGAASPFTQKLYDNFAEDDAMFGLLKYLLCSKYYGRQYLGVIIQEICILYKSLYERMEENDGDTEH